MPRLEDDWCDACKEFTSHYVYDDPRYANDERKVCRACAKRRNQKRPKKGCAQSERICKHHGAVEFRKYVTMIRTTYRCPLCIKAANDKQTARRKAMYGSS